MCWSIQPVVDDVSLKLSTKEYITLNMGSNIYSQFMFNPLAPHLPNDLSTYLQFNYF